MWKMRIVNIIDNYSEITRNFIHFLRIPSDSRPGDGKVNPSEPSLRPAQHTKHADTPIR